MTTQLCNCSLYWWSDTGLSGISFVWCYPFSCVWCYLFGGEQLSFGLCAPGLCCIFDRTGKFQECWPNFPWLDLGLQSWKVVRDKDRSIESILLFKHLLPICLFKQMKLFGLILNSYGVGYIPLINWRYYRYASRFVSGSKMLWTPLHMLAENCRSLHIYLLHRTPSRANRLCCL